MKERAKGEQESNAAKAVRVVANVLAVHLASRKTRGFQSPLTGDDRARLKLMATIAQGPHREHVLPILKEGMGWEPKPKDEPPQGTA